MDKEMDKGLDKKIAIVHVLRRFITDSKDVRFEGDGYSEEWVKEAEKRGLPNVKDTPHALDEFLLKETLALYAKYNVLTKLELEARNEIKLENYIMKVQIESRTMGDLVHNHIIPTTIKYQNKLIDNDNGLEALGLDNKHVKQSIDSVLKYLKIIMSGLGNMITERRRVNKIEDSREKAIAYCDDVKISISIR